MAWMSGNSVNIFSIMITIYSFINPFRAIMGVGGGISLHLSSFTKQVFAPYEDPALNLLPQKLTFIAINMVVLIIAVYKGYVLGILPTASDWLASLPVKEVFVVSLLI